MSKVAASILLSASTLINPINPTNPKGLSFDASAYVTVNNQVRLAVEKTSDVPVVVLLRNKDNQVLFHQNISRKDAKYAVKLDVSELANGEYELEVKSSEGSIRKQLNLSNQAVVQPRRTITLQ
ncbi:hypothetical protein IC230_22715 [Spirosoma sp. BT704]|uniref:Secretion system C-terminal sorting domain-containing protein n=2 Tax=Spirosoma validum TaxID=2771355 RepID=A0A927B4Y4_9BACT|nr:hypothetical protein [Spirosoma validum]